MPWSRTALFWQCTNVELPSDKANSLENRRDGGGAQMSDAEFERMVDRGGFVQKRSRFSLEGGFQFRRLKHE